MKLTDKAILRMVSESPGRNTSEPIGGPDKKLDPRGRVFSCRTKATGCVARLSDEAHPSGGVVGTAR